VQLSVTGSLNALTGDTCRLYVAVCPAVIVADVVQLPFAGQFAPVAAASEKSVPVPERATICVEDEASLSVIARLPEITPVAVGWKETLIVQLLLGTIAAVVQFSDFTTNPADGVTPVTTRLAVPAFVRVTGFEVLGGVLISCGEKGVEVEGDAAGVLS
jgi:hypothetical protein